MAAWWIDKKQKSAEAIKNMKNNILLAGILALFLGAGTSHAAPITWGTSGTMSGDSDVVVPTVGTLIFADGFTPSAASYVSQAYTINGVAFTAYNGNSNGTTYGGDVTFAGLQGNYGIAYYNNLANANWGSSTDGYKNIFSGTSYSPSGSAASVTISGLTAGYTYQIELWANNTYTYDTADGGTQTFYTDGNIGTESPLVSQGSSTSLGEWITGTFVADGSTEVIDFAGTSGFGSLAGMTLYETAVPEPSTVALLSMAAGLAGLVAVRRFRLVSVPLV
jgi:hypothetical protein